MRAYLLSTIWGRFIWRMMQGIAFSLAGLVFLFIIFWMFQAIAFINVNLHLFLWEHFEWEESARNIFILGFFIAISLGATRAVVWKDSRKSHEQEKEDPEIISHLSEEPE